MSLTIEQPTIDALNQSLREQGLPLKAAKHPTDGNVIVLTDTVPIRSFNFTEAPECGEHGETLHATQLLTPSERDFPWAMKALLGGAMVTRPGWRCGYWVLGDNGGLVDELGATVEYPYANLLETDFLLYEPPGETVHNELRLSKAECATLRADLEKCRQELASAWLTRETQVLKNVHERRRQEALIAQ